MIPRGQFATHSASPARVQTRAVWTDQVPLTERVRELNSGTRIQIDPALNTTVLELMRRVSPAVADAMNRHLAPFAKRTFDGWPVRSGFSRSLLALEFAPDGARSFTGRVVARAEYSGYIRGGTLARQMLDRGEQAATLMAVDLADELSR